MKEGKEGVDMQEESVSIEELINLIDTDRLQQIQKEFEEILQTSIAIQGANNQILTKPSERWLKKQYFCRIFEPEIPKDDKIFECKTNFVEKAKELDEPTYLSCPAGLTHIIAPIKAGDQRVAAILISGPCKTSESNFDQFKRSCRTKDELKIEHIFRNIPEMDSNTLDDTKRRAGALANIIAVTLSEKFHIIYNLVGRLYQKPLTEENIIAVQKLIVEEAKKLVKAEEGCLLLLENNVVISGVECEHFKKMTQRHCNAPLIRGSIIEKVIQMKSPLLINDIQHHQWEGVREEIKAQLTIPLIYEDEILGVIVMMSYSNPYAFQDFQIRPLEILAKHASNAISIRRMIKERDRLIDQLESIQGISILINSPYILEDILDIILDESLQLMNATEGYILLVDEKKRVLKTVCARGRRKEEVPELPIQESGSILGWVAYKNKPYVCNNVKEDPLYLCISEKILSQITVPLTYEDKVIGVLDIESEKENAFSKDDIKILTLIASQAAIAIKKAQFLKETNEMYESLLHASRLISVGEIAATVAHEVGNSFNTIALSVKNIKENKEVAKIEEIKGKIEDIDEEMRRLSEIIYRLTDYSRKAKSERKEDIDINEVAQQSLNLLKPMIETKKIQCKFVPQPNLPPVSGDKVQIFEVCNNILLNALWAVGRKGKLDVRTYLSDKEVIIRIADDGIGIPPQNLPKIFDPFFTTKKKGEGTGLGLYISKKIVERHGGSIEVERNRTGKGTTFYIHLPKKEE